jgi:hypothetical protein
MEKKNMPGVPLPVLLDPASSEMLETLVHIKGGLGKAIKVEDMPPRLRDSLEKAIAQSLGVSPASNLKLLDMVDLLGAAKANTEPDNGCECQGCQLRRRIEAGTISDTEALLELANLMAAKQDQVKFGNMIEHTITEIDEAGRQKQLFHRFNADFVSEEAIDDLEKRMAQAVGGKDQNVWQTVCNDPMVMEAKIERDGKPVRIVVEQKFHQVRIK